MAEGYRSRLHNDVVPLTPRRPVSIATAVGRGLGALADAGLQIAEDNRRTDQFVAESEARIREEEKRRAGSRLSAGFAGRLSQSRIEAQRRIEAARAETAPGAPGWDQRVTEINEAVYGDLLDEFGPQADEVDPELGQRFGALVQSVTGEALSREIAWAGKKAQEWEGDQFEQLVATEKNGLIGIAPDKMPEALKLSMLRVRATLEGTDYDGTTRERLLQLAYSQLVTGGALTGLEQQGAYGDINALVGSGELDALLGDKKGNWLDTAKAGAAAQAKAAEQAAAAERDAWREEWDVLKLRLDRGEDVPANEINAFLSRGQTLGVEADELREAGYLSIDTAYSSTARGLDDRTLTRTIADLRAKRQAGELTNEEDRYLQRLDAESSERGTKKGEALSTLWGSGPEGRVSALTQVRAMPEDAAWAAANKSGQPKLYFLGRMPSSVHRLAIEGANVRASKGGADRWLPVTAGKPDLAAADRSFANLLGPQLAGQMRSAGTYDALREAALDYYIGNRARSGDDGWSRPGFVRAIRAAAGTTETADGKYIGGLGVVRGRTIELPDRMTAAEFDEQFSRADFRGAHYRGGGIATKPNVLAHYMPAPVGSTSGREVTYQFLDARNEPLLDGERKPFTLTFKVPR